MGYHFNPVLLHLTQIEDFQNKVYRSLMCWQYISISVQPLVWFCLMLLGRASSPWTWRGLPCDIFICFVWGSDHWNMLLEKSSCPQRGMCSLFEELHEEARSTFLFMDMKKLLAWRIITWRSKEYNPLFMDMKKLLAWRITWLIREHIPLCGHEEAFSRSTFQWLEDDILVTASISLMLSDHWKIIGTGTILYCTFLSADCMVSTAFAHEIIW